MVGGLLNTHLFFLQFYLLFLPHNLAARSGFKTPANETCKVSAAKYCGVDSVDDGF